MLRMSIDLMKENGFTLKKTRSRRYLAQTITDADYSNDIALLANTSNQAKSLLHSLEPAAGGIGIHVNADKTEFMSFNQNQIRDISTRTGSPLKLVDKFTRLGSSVSSTENDINTRRAKTWSVFDRLSVIWKSDLSDKIKPIFLGSGRVHTHIWMRHMEADKAHRETTAISPECYELY